MNIVSSPYMDKLYRQIICEIPNIQLIKSLENHFFNKDALYLVDEHSKEDIDHLIKNQCAIKIFTDFENSDSGIYKYQSIRKIIQHLESPIHSWVLVVNYQLEKHSFDLIIEETKKQHPNALTIDLTLSECSNFNLYDYKRSLEKNIAPPIITTQETIKLISCIKDYVEPPLFLIQTFLNQFHNLNELFLFTESIKNPLDLYVFNHAKKIIILSNEQNASVSLFINHLIQGMSIVPLHEVLTPDDFIKKLRIRRI